MRRFPFLLISCLILVLLLSGRTLVVSGQQDQPTPAAISPASGKEVLILAPLPGQAVQGSLAITGWTAIPGFRSAELSFGYSGDTTGTWFLIAAGIGPVNGGKLADWDTSTLTDGNYTLKLIVTLQDGRQVITQVEGIRVRNYSPIEPNTATPAPTASRGDTPIPLTPTQTRVPSATPIPKTPTPLPPNPAEFTSQDFTTSLLRGIFGVLVLFGITLLISSIRRIFHR